MLKGILDLVLLERLLLLDLAECRRRLLDLVPNNLCWQPLFSFLCSTGNYLLPKLFSVGLHLLLLLLKLLHSFSKIVLPISVRPHLEPFLV